MNENALSLKAFIQTLAEAIMYSNNMLRGNRNKETDESKNEGVPVSPQPLYVAGMRVSFAANVINGNKENDIYLDFLNSNGNFKGEIVFKHNDTKKIFENSEIDLDK